MFAISAQLFFSFSIPPNVVNRGGNLDFTEMGGDPLQHDPPDSHALRLARENDCILRMGCMSEGFLRAMGFRDCQQLQNQVLPKNPGGMFTVPALAKR